MDSRRFHVSLGLVALLPLTLTSVTGMLMVGRQALLDRQFPSRLEAPSTGQALSLDACVSKVEQVDPALRIETLYWPADAAHTLRVRGRTAPDAGATTYYLAPASGEIVARQGPSRLDLTDWILRLHRGTWGGLAGRAFMSLLACGGALLWPTGLVIGWVRRRKTARDNGTRPRRRSAMVAHRRLGNLLGGLFTFMALSGAVLNFVGELSRVVDPVPAIAAAGRPADTNRSAVSLQRKMALARAQRPGVTLASIHLPSAKQPLVLFYFADNSRVYMDPGQDVVHKVTGPASHWVHAILLWHSGRVFGGAGPLLILAMGAGALWTGWLGGLLVWRQRKRVARRWRVVVALPGATKEAHGERQRV